MNLAAPEVARTAQNGRVHRQAGFTLVELMMVIGIIALLAAIALPSYQRYIERAHLATVLVDIDALRIKSQVISQESGRDLCNWNYRSSTVGVHNEASRQLDSLIKETRAALDPRRWDLRFVRPGSLVDGSPFTLQFGAQGDAAQLARTRLLAEELQRDGLFAQWKRNTAAAAIFTVYLGPCSASAAGAAPAPLTTTGTTTTPTPPSIPPGTLPVVAPAASVPVAPPQPIQQVPDRIPAQVPAVAPALIPPSTGTGSTGSTGGAGTVAPPSATGLPGTSSSSQSGASPDASPDGRPVPYPMPGHSSQREQQGLPQLYPTMRQQLTRRLSPCLCNART